MTESSSKNGTRRPMPDAVAKLVPLRSRTDSERSEPTSTRSRLRNALPGANHTHQQSRETKQVQSHRQVVKETVQSALELRPPIHFDHLLRRDKKGTPSRRNSGNDAIKGDVELSDLQQTTRALKERVDDTDIDRFRRDNGKREEELRSALQQVEEQGMQSTRELDNTYYVLLEKAEALRTVIGNMQQLAEESRQFRTSFRAQSQTLHNEMVESIDNYDSFNEQEDSINSLLSRLETYRNRTAALNKRLDGAKHRVEVCEKRILRAQAQRRKRWSITWAIMFAVAVAILALLLSRSGPNVEAISIMKASALTGKDTDYTSPFLAALKATSDDARLDDLFNGVT